MDSKKEKFTPNPREHANLFSILFFTYTVPMFKKGYSKDLDVDDIYNPLPADSSQRLGDRLESKWFAHLKHCKTNPNFMKVLLLTFWPEYLYLGVIKFIEEIVLRLSLPLALGRLLDYFNNNSTTSSTEALWYASAVVVINALCALLLNHYTVNAYLYGMRVRAACCALIYRKSLRLSKTALGETATGKMINLLSNDVSRFDFVTYLLNHMWSAPLSTVLAMYFLYTISGFSGLIGVVPILLVTPLQSYTGKLTAIYRKRTAYKTDERVRLMDEIITGIQVIKMYAWEKPFVKLIQMARRNELKIIIKSSYVRGVFMAFSFFTTRAALFSTFVAMSLMREPITASKMFVLLSYYNFLGYTMSYMFVRGISEIAEVFVGVKRLQQFLMSDEFTINKPPLSCSEVLVNLKNVTAKWGKNSADDALRDITVSMRRGELFGVIGPVGSGKSSFLEAILGELVVTSGSKEISGSLSYASQDAWIFGASVRQNILFGSEYDKNRYNDVVRVCSLGKDFEQFPEGDLTLVGDRGASLSGGQKARINLARAVYRDADVYLLDDPLSAVDVHVSKHLYEECINGYLKNKTRILVTHQVHHLKNADNILVFENGRIVDAQLFRVKSEMGDDASVNEINLQEEKPDTEDEEKGNVKDERENTSKGKVKGSLFFKYLNSGGNFLVVTFVIALYLLTQSIASGTDYFVTYWIKIEESERKAMATTQHHYYLYIYGTLIASLFGVALWRSFAFYNLAMSCSQKLHDNLFSNVVTSRMRFFDTNSSGRIINRFSKDLGAIDELLPKVILDAGQILLAVVGSITLVTIVNPYFLILIAVFGALCLIIRHIVLKSTKNIKRLEGIMRGPVFTHLSASINGLTTIRAFGAQKILSDGFDKHQDYHTGSWFMYIVANSGYSFCMDFICCIFVTTITFSFVLYGSRFGFEASQVALAITQAMALTNMMQWGMKQSTEISNQLLSVERVLEYNLLEPEPQPVKPLVPPTEWPASGKIVFKSLGLRYDDNMPLVLRSLNIVINPKEKVGIVGRTGAGKSSIIAALFRLAIIEGHIEIDHIDTKNLLLQTLRSRISIIPQDPVLFSGTLRYNLDPFEEYDDNVLYQAISEVELKDAANIINRLENRVMDRGSNYSVGQRQLICLARALIRNNKILMLDEATANVDPQTDASIQNTIRTKFANCTVLTVAHRLNTIMDSDKVLVMDNGTAVEYDHPYVLLQKPDGVFNKMVKDAGKSLSEQLKHP